jgi:hypothetical protein
MKRKKKEDKPKHATTKLKRRTKTRQKEEPKMIGLKRKAWGRSTERPGVTLSGPVLGGTV